MEYTPDVTIRSTDQTLETMADAVFSISQDIDQFVSEEFTKQMFELSKQVHLLVEQMDAHNQHMHRLIRLLQSK